MIRVVLPAHLKNLAHVTGEVRLEVPGPGAGRITQRLVLDTLEARYPMLLGTIRDRLKAGAPIDHLALGVAAWMRYVSGTDEKGATIDVRDPLAATFAEKAKAAGRNATALTQSLLGIEAIFGADLPREERFTQPVEKHLAALFEKGAKATADSLS